MKSAKEDLARWLAVVELSLFLTRAWADFLFPDKELPHARELMLVGGVIFIWDLKGKPLTETGVSRVIGMTLKPDVLIARHYLLGVGAGALHVPTWPMILVAAGPGEVLYHGCCAPAASGQTAAVPPRRVISSC